MAAWSRLRSAVPCCPQDSKQPFLSLGSRPERSVDPAASRSRAVLAQNHALQETMLSSVDESANVLVRAHYRALLESLEFFYLCGEVLIAEHVLLEARNVGRNYYSPSVPLSRYPRASVIQQFCIVLSTTFRVATMCTSKLAVE